MSAIEDQSAKIAALVWGEGADPTPTPTPTPTPHPIIDLITSIFGKLLPMLLSCLGPLATPQRVTKMFNRQLLGHRAQLDECVDQVCSDDDPKAAIKQAFRKVGKTIKEPDVEAMLTEAKAL